MKIAVITTSRADWNSLGMVAKALRAHADVLVMGGVENHPALAAIEADGFRLHPADLYSEHLFFCSAAEKVLHTSGMALASLGALLWADRPDMVVLCGDRHETLLAAFCAAAMGILVAHLAGGDVSGGSLDERWRHAITKMADVHFPTHQRAAERIIQMGEDPSDVHMLGSASIDRLIATDILPRGQTCKALGLPDARSFILGNWQAGIDTPAELPDVVAALVNIHAPTVWVGVNPEIDGEWASDLIAKAPRRDWVAHQNLAPQVYLSALAHCACLVGNSSSGFYEAPYYGTPVINVGSRQTGRGPRPQCMIGATVRDFPLALRTADSKWVRSGPEYPFGKGAAKQIAETILGYDGHGPGRKIFHE